MDYDGRVPSRPEKNTWTMTVLLENTGKSWNFVIYDKNGRQRGLEQYNTL